MVCDSLIVIAICNNTADAWRFSDLNLPPSQIPHGFDYHKIDYQIHPVLVIVVNLTM